MVQNIVLFSLRDNDLGNFGPSLRSHVVLRRFRQRTLTYVVRESISVWLTSCFICFDSATLPVLS